MITIFIVSQQEGSYDDYRSWPVAASYDEQKVKNYITDMEQRLIKANAANDSIDQHMLAWEQAHPRPDIRFVNRNPPFFKGPKKKWSNEQKAELKKYEDEYQKNATAAAKPFNDWATKRYEEQVRFSHTLPEDIQRDLSLGDDATWAYDSITIIE